MLIRDDKFNLDGTVTTYVDCYMEMPQVDYLLWKYVHCLKQEEKEKLLLEGVPNATNGRISPHEEYEEILQAHTKRLKFFSLNTK